jgi:predicted porin
MRNTKIALAVLALVASTAAMANDGVTIYGTIDAGVMKSSVAQGAAAKLSNSAVESGLLSPNFLGFRASESLDGGMKIDAHVQTAYNAATGVGGFGFTQSDVGIAADFGTVRLGRTVDPFWGQGVAGFDAAGGSNIGSAVGPVINMGLSAIFPQNTITYLSPNIGGFSAAGQIRNADKPSTTVANRSAGDGYSATVNYTMGPVSVGGGLMENKLDTTVPANSTADQKKTGNFLGAGYDMGVAKINAVYLTAKEEGIPSVGTTAKLNTWGLNGSVPFGAVTLIAGYYNGNEKNGAGTKVGDGKMYHLTGIYALSKRSSLFANYQSVNNNRSFANTVFGLNTGSNVGTETAGGSNAFTVGLRHTF